jgi:hypothetical protein
MAYTGSVRRRRQGPKAARMRGRSEATSLARYRAQIEHRLRDGRRIYRSRVRCLVAHSKADNDRASRRRFNRLHNRARNCCPSVIRTPPERHEIVRTKRVTIDATISAQITAHLDPGGAIVDNDTDTGGHAVSDPSGQARDHFGRAQRGRSRHGVLSPAATLTPARGRHRSPPVSMSTRAPRPSV